MNRAHTEDNNYSQREEGDSTSEPMQMKFVVHMFTKPILNEALQKHIVSGGFDGPANEAQI